MAFIFIFLMLLLPGQSYMAYRKYNLDKLCPSERTNSYIDSVYHTKDSSTIKLHDSPSTSSVLVEHVWDNSSHKHFHHCEFNIQAHSKWLHGPTGGIFAAIRELNFRQNAAGECIDYVIFELNTLTAPTSHKVCRTVDIDDYSLDENNFFEIPEGSLKVIVHIGRHSLEPEKITMKLTFTAFEDCSGTYRFRCTNSKCISNNLVNDLIINCIPPFCSDEPKLFSECGTRPAFVLPDSNFIAICSTVAFAVVGVTLSWYLLKIYVFCNRHTVNPTNDGNGANGVSTNPDPTVEYRQVYVPPDTDGPPSYDSIFK